MIFTDELRDTFTNPPIRDVSRKQNLYPSSASCVVQDPQTKLRRVVGGPNGCLRNQYYSMRGFAETNGSSPEGMLKAEFGGFIQERIEHRLKQAGLWFASEKRIWIPHMRLSGRLDTWCWDPESLKPGRSRVPIPIEFKSTSGYREGGLIKPSKGKLLPKDDHVAQVIPYLDFLSQWPEDFHGDQIRIVIFAISRESMKWMEHVVFLGGKGKFGMPIQEDERYAIVQNEAGTFQLPYMSVRAVYNRWLQLNQFLRQKEVPPRDFDLQYDNDKLALLAENELLPKTKRAKIVSARKKDPDGQANWLPGEGDWQCAYCGFKDLCWTGIEHQQPPVFRQDLPHAAEATPPPITEPI